MESYNANSNADMKFSITKTLLYFAGGKGQGKAK